MITEKTNALSFKKNILSTCAMLEETKATTSSVLGMLRDIGKLSILLIKYLGLNNDSLLTVKTLI